MVLNQSATTTQKQTSTARAMPQTLRHEALIFNGAESPRNETLGLLKNKPPF